MHVNDTNSTSFLPTQRWFKTTVASCVWVLFSILFVGQFSSHLQKKYHAHATANTILDFSIEKNEWTSEILPFQIPLDPAQHAMGECSATDDEMNEDMDDHGASSLLHNIPEDIYQAASVDNFSMVVYAFSKVKSIPLFILYHAWKSNLA